MTQPISGLSAIAGRYDVVLCDVWGVIHNGVESFAPACDALVKFGETRGPVVLISNAPRPASAVHAQLRQLGVPDTAWTGFVTSGDATRALLAARAPGPVFRIGPERDKPLYDDLGLTFSELEDAAVISCAGLFDDETETAEDYRPMLARGVEKGLAFICANPDRVVQRGDRLIPCAGALADIYTELGGRVLMAGKPYKPTYDLALAEAERLSGRQVERARVLCIGDGIPTDIAGANAQDLDCLFVTGGIHGDEDTHALLAKAGAHAAYALKDLRW